MKGSRRGAQPSSRLVRRWQGYLVMSYSNFSAYSMSKTHNLLPVGSAHIHLTEQAVQQDLCSQSVKQGPGPDKLSIGTIRLLWM